MVRPRSPVLLEQRGRLLGRLRYGDEGGQRLHDGMKMRDVHVDAENADGLAICAQDGADRLDAPPVPVHLLVRSDDDVRRLEVDLVQERRLAELPLGKGVGQVDHCLGREIVEHHFRIRLEEQGDGIADWRIARQFRRERHLGVGFARPAHLSSVRTKAASRSNPSSR
jgi:hypothetical protein